jgi:hypothetical protein
LSAEGVHQEVNSILLNGVYLSNCCCAYCEIEELDSAKTLPPPYSCGIRIERQ